MWGRIASLVLSPAGRQVALCAILALAAYFAVQEYRDTKAQLTAAVTTITSLNDTMQQMQAEAVRQAALTMAKIEAVRDVLDHGAQAANSLANDIVEIGKVKDNGQPIPLPASLGLVFGQLRSHTPTDGGNQGADAGATGGAYPLQFTPRAP